MDDKKSFVENELKNALMRADSNISDVLYDKVLFDDCEENNAILVFYKNSDIKIINEDGDKMTIMFREPLKTPY